MWCSLSFCFDEYRSPWSGDATIKYTVAPHARQTVRRHRHITLAAPPPITPVALSAASGVPGDPETLSHWGERRGGGPSQADKCTNSY